MKMQLSIDELGDQSSILGGAKVDPASHVVRIWVRAPIWDALRYKIRQGIITELSGNTVNFSMRMY